jgi:uncharacterized protein YjiS (DUF1127 family)
MIADAAAHRPSWNGMLSRPPGGLWGAINKMTKRLAAHRINRRAEAELMALSDRTLNDIGLPRGTTKSMLMERQLR